MHPDADPLTALEKAVIACTRCPRLRIHCERVAREKVRRFAGSDYWGKPVPGFGDPRARLLVLGLAPAAHGGNRTGRVFTGDRSGEWLFRSLFAAGFSDRPQSEHRGDGVRLHDCYVTAAVRCAPPGNKPLREELDACRTFLVRELTLLARVRVVVALGQLAFRAYLDARRALARPVPSPLPRFRHGQVLDFADVILIASYHPSQQNTFTGRLTVEMLDAVFRRARDLLCQAH
ncbi:MAG: uracil-DNA glycosylase [Gammaproteobacteria bacterium]